MKTFSAKPLEVERKWYLIDADGATLGRLAVEVANILRGKNKPQFTPNVDTGDFVVVINADKVVLTGNKLTDKKYFRHSGYPGGEKEVVYKDLMANRSDFVLEKAIKGMLPKNSLGKKMFQKLKCYKGSEHPHQAQQPVELKIKGVRG